MARGGPSLGCAHLALLPQSVSKQSPPVGMAMGLCVLSRSHRRVPLQTQLAGQPSFLREVSRLWWGPGELRPYCWVYGNAMVPLDLSVVESVGSNDHRIQVCHV